MKTKTGRLILALILASFLMPALHAQEKVYDDKMAVVSTQLPTDTTAATSDHTPTTDSKAPEASFDSDPVPTPPLPNTGPEEAIAEASPDVDDQVDISGSEEVVKEKSWLDTIKDYLYAGEGSIAAKSALMIEKMKYRHEYGDDADSSVNFPVLSEAKQALEDAEEVRRQKQLAFEIAEAERQKLYNESLMCLALNGFHEARGETADQEVASAAVVLNRLSVGFRGATTICEVIYTPKQFSWVEQHGIHTPDTSNPVEKKAWQRSLLIAKRMLDPDATFIDPSNGALYYYNPSIVDWRYKHAYRQVAVLGNHRFMTETDVNHPHHIDNTKVRINPVLFNGLTHAERDQLKEQFELKGGE